MYFHRLSKGLRNQEKFFVRRFSWFLNQGGFQVFILASYVMYGTLFLNIPQGYQWMLAFTSPIIREIFLWITLKLACKASGTKAEDKSTIKYPILHYNSTNYAVFLAIVVGGLANAVTSNCILVIDFMEQMYHGLKIVWKYNKRNKDVEGM